MATTSEILLALRAPGADWLATLIMALDEAGRDPDFSPHLASVFADLATQARDQGRLPAAVLAAAQARTNEFTTRLAADLAEDALAEPVMPERAAPSLTVVAAG